MDNSNNQTIAALQSHVAHLTNLVERVNTLRKIPGLLLAPSTLTGSQLEQGFGQINDLKTVVDGSSTQECLKHAQESFSKSHENVSLDGRRQSRKRRRPPSPVVPDSPHLPPVLPEQTFPPTRFPPLTLSGLPSFVREHNKSEFTLKLHIWSSTMPSPQTIAPESNYERFRGTIVRIGIKDVLYAYVTLGVIPTIDRIHINTDLDQAHDSQLGESRVIIESLTIFGPRERKSPHSQSDFMVFQKVSQYITWMIQTEPEIELRGLITLFKSYESLFVAQCTICHRVLSEEGHFPPVCRVWTPYRKSRDPTSAVERDSGVLDETNDGRWEPRHQACLNKIMRG